jgi:PncC family amidohydrolase
MTTSGKRERHCGHAHAKIKQTGAAQAARNARIACKTEVTAMGPLIELAGRIGHRLRERGETIAVAESSTGGLISASLLAVPGASAYFLGGAVVYTRQARRTLLSIPDSAMAGIRSASEPYAVLLASTIREKHAATWGLSETGAAGPTGNRYGDPAGHACIAVSGPSQQVLTVRTGSPDRQANMQAFAARALETLLASLDT